MSKITGKNGSVRYGSNIVADQVSWSMSGISLPTTKAAGAFGDTVAVKEAAEVPDPGTFEFNGNFDPNDPNGQEALATVCKNGTHLTDLYLYVNTSTFWRVGSGGYIIVTKAQAPVLPRNGYGTVSFSGDISSAFMEKVGTGT